MTYEQLRHFADSYALAVMAILYLILIGWAFRPSRRAANDRAATMIFDKDTRVVEDPKKDLRGFWGKAPAP